MCISDRYYFERSSIRDIETQISIGSLCDIDIIKVHPLHVEAHLSTTRLSLR